MEPIFGIMKVFLASINNKIHPKAFTSLKSLCNDIKISYSLASKGKRTFIDDAGELIIIGEADVVKIKRQGKFKHASNIPDRL